MDGDKLGCLGWDDGDGRIPDRKGDISMKRTKGQKLAEQRLKAYMDRLTAKGGQEWAVVWHSGLGTYVAICNDAPRLMLKKAPSEAKARTNWLDALQLVVPHWLDYGD